MTELAPLSLDDLTYEDLRQMAMRRIPAASGGRWSHHEPVDAGVTLLELFAFLLDQQVFVLDQVPDSMTLALLALLDEEPELTGVARVLVAPPVPSRVEDAGLLPAGSGLRPVDQELESLVFSTRDAVHNLAVESLDVFSDGISLSDRLDRGASVAVMTNRGGAASLSFEVVLAQPFEAGDAGQPLSVGLVLDAPNIAPEWSAEAVDVSPPVRLDLHWHAAGAGGQIADWSDGTGGLRRSGVVRFALPNEAVGADVLRFTLSTHEAEYAIPPKLRDVFFGATIAEHRHGVDVPVVALDTPAPTALQAHLIESARNMLPISSQVLALPQEWAPALSDSIVLRLGDRTGAVHTWHPTPDLLPHGPEDRVFRFDREAGVLSFGDGYAGRVPAPVTAIGISLEVGGGPAGNHSAGLMWQSLGDNRPLVSADQARGGRAAETLDEARARVASNLGARFRAVTRADYKTLVETTEGIGAHRAFVLPGFDPSFPCVEIADSVTVFVVPRSGIEVVDPATDEGALETIRNRLEAARLLTTRVFVRLPVFRPVGVHIEISAAQGDAAGFADMLRPVMTRYLHPALGGPDQTGWAFGGALRPSELRRVCSKALEGEAHIERLEVTLIDSGAVEDCTELGIGAAELVYLDTLSVAITGTAPEGVSF